MENEESAKGLSVIQKAMFIALLIFGMWFIELVDFVAASGGLDQLGIRPRTKSGLWGILRAPLLHASWQHLSANTIPFGVLGFLVLLRGGKDFLFATAVIVVLGGAGVWLLGHANSVHVGASGLIFGYLGFLVVVGVLERSFTGVVVCVLVVFLYGSILRGVLPTQDYISWEGHLFGLVAGGLAAKWWVGFGRSDVR